MSIPSGPPMVSSDMQVMPLCTIPMPPHDLSLPPPSFPPLRQTHVPLLPTPLFSETQIRKWQARGKKAGPSEVSGKKAGPSEGSPVTVVSPVTVFVGNIAPRLPATMMPYVLAACGTILNWRQVSTFGFCKFASPEAGSRCVRLLHDREIAGQKLVVRIETGTKQPDEDNPEQRDELNAEANTGAEDTSRGTPPPEDHMDDVQHSLYVNALWRIEQLISDHRDEIKNCEARQKEEQRQKTDRAISVASIDDEKRRFVHSEIDKFREIMKERSDDHTVRHLERERKVVPLATRLRLGSVVEDAKTKLRPKRTRTPPPPKLGSVKLRSDRDARDLSVGNADKLRRLSRSPPRGRHGSPERDRNRRDKPPSSRGDSHRSAQASGGSNRVEERRPHSIEDDRDRKYQESRCREKHLGDKDAYWRSEGSGWHSDAKRSPHLPRSGQESYSKKKPEDHDSDKRPDYEGTEVPHGGKRRRSLETDKYPDARAFKKRFERQDSDNRQTEIDIEKRHSDKCKSGGQSRRTRSPPCRKSNSKEDSSLKASDRRRSSPRENLGVVSPNERQRVDSDGNPEAVQGSSNIPIQQECPKGSITIPDQSHPLGNFPKQANQQAEPSPMNFISQIPMMAATINKLVKLLNKNANNTGIDANNVTSTTNEDIDPNVLLQINSWRTQYQRLSQAQGLSLPAPQNLMQWSVQNHQQLYSIQGVPHEMPDTGVSPLVNNLMQNTITTVKNPLNLPAQHTFNPHRNVAQMHVPKSLAVVEEVNKYNDDRSGGNQTLTIEKPPLSPVRNLAGTVDQTNLTPNMHFIEKNVCNVSNNLQTSRSNSSGDGLLTADNKVRELRVISQHIFTKLCNDYSHAHKSLKDEEGDLKDIFVEAILSRILMFEDLDMSLPSQVLLKYNVMFDTDAKNIPLIMRILKKYTEMRRPGLCESPLIAEQKAETLNATEFRTTPVASSDVPVATSTRTTITSKANYPSVMTEKAVPKNETTPHKPNSKWYQTSNVKRLQTEPIRQVPQTLKVSPLPTQPIRKLPQASEVKAVPSKELRPMPQTSKATPVPPKSIGQVQMTSKATPVPPKSIGQVQPTSKATRVPPKSIGQVQTTSKATRVPPKSIGQVQTTSKATRVPPKSIGQVQATSKATPVPPKSIGQVQTTSKATRVPPKSIGQVQATSKATPVPSKSIGQVQATPKAPPIRVKLGSPSLFYSERAKPHQGTHKAVEVSRAERNIATYEIALQLVDVMLREKSKNETPVDNIQYSMAVQLADFMHRTFVRIINAAFEADNDAHENRPVVKIQLTRNFCNYIGMQSFLKHYEVLNGAYIKYGKFWCYYATLPNEEQCQAMLSTGEQREIGDQCITVRRSHVIWSYNGARPTCIDGVLNMPQGSEASEIPSAPFQVISFNGNNRNKKAKSQIYELDDN